MSLPTFVPPHRTWRLRVAALALLALSGPALAQGLALPPASGNARASVQEPASADAIAALAKVYQAPQPRPSNPELEQVVARFESPQAAFEFVRDRIALQAYPGALHGPQATLTARAGNPLDRARLLSALLRGQGLTTRFARGDADEALVAKLVGRITSEPVAKGNADSLFLRAVTARASQSYGGLRDAASQKLAASLDLAALRAPAQRELADHWWVEFERGGEWISADASLHDGEMGAALATAGAVFDDVPEDRFQTLTLRVVAELETDGVLSRQVALDYTAPAEGFTREVVALGVADEGLGASLSKVLSDAVGLESFRPVLRVGSQQIIGDHVRMAGPETDDGGLLAELDFGDESAEPWPTLVGLVLEMDFAAPESDTWEVRRLLYDRLETADRLAWESAGHADGKRVTAKPEDRAVLAQALEAQHLLHAYDGAHNVGDWLQTSQRLTDAVMDALRADAPLDTPMSASDAQTLQSVLWRALPITSDLLLVPAVNDHDGLRFYPERPRVVVISTYVPSGTDGMAVAVDLLQDRLRAVPADGLPPAALAERRLWFGALQGAMEAEFARLPLLFVEPDVEVRMQGAAFLTALSLAPTDAPSGAGLARSHAQLAGRWAVVGDGDPDAFWDIDPASGETRAVSEPGMGYAHGATFVKNVIARRVHIPGYGNGVARISTEELFKILNNARRLPGRPGPLKTTANEYLIVTRTAIYNSVPASLNIGLAFSVSMFIATIAIDDGLKGKDWTDRL